MQKDAFDKLMEKWGWIYKGNKEMPLLATEGQRVDWDKVAAAHKYSHRKAGMTICADDEEIEKVQDDKFEDWLEETARPYFESRLFEFCTGGRRKTAEGEYIDAQCYGENWMNLQIERLTEDDDYILQKRDKEMKNGKELHTATFFKARPQ